MLQTTPPSPAPAVPSSQPSAHALAVWRDFLRTHAHILRQLESDLVREQQLPLASYDVLVQLVEAPDRRLRMTELAEKVLISRSGLTRLVDRLAREGLVVREACESDARGLFAVLTPAGYERLRVASTTHLRGVEEHVTSRLSEEDLRDLARVLGKLPGAAGQLLPPLA
jgi:DNA-binding MarR family transcriptional regulator